MFLYFFLFRIISGSLDFREVILFFILFLLVVGTAVIAARQAVEIAELGHNFLHVHFIVLVSLILINRRSGLLSS